MVGMRVQVWELRAALPTRLHCMRLHGSSCRLQQGNVGMTGRTLPRPLRSPALEEAAHALRMEGKHAIVTEDAAWAMGTRLAWAWP